MVLFVTKIKFFFNLTNCLVFVIVDSVATAIGFIFNLRWIDVGLRCIVVDKSS